MAKRKVELGLVRGEERSLPNIDRVRELVKELKQDEVDVVVTETKEFFRERQTGILSYIAMGGHLAKVREVLEPHKMWKDYANSLPSMGIATAYRYIWAWENAQALPPATLRIVARDGVRLLSMEKGKGIAPKFEQAVKAVTKEVGPAPDNEIEATRWLHAVVEKKRVLAKTKPKDAHRNGMQGQLKRVMLTVKRAMKKVPGDRRGQFLQKVIDGLLAMGSVKIPPQSERVA